MIERLLPVDVVEPDGEIEAEHALVRASSSGGELQMNDGTLITFDREELLAALVEEQGAARAPWGVRCAAQSLSGQSKARA